jgi:imidazolonepropionase-like amidohydrolase
VSVADWIIADRLWWDGRFQPDTALRLDGGFARAVPVGEIPRGAARRRLPGTLLPGLCDAHVHSALVDLGTVRAGGIAAVWDLGGVPEKVLDLAERARRPESKLPRIRLAGPFLTAPGGYPSDRAWAPAGSWREIHGPDDAASAVAEARAGGATLIKVTAHAGGPMLPPATLGALVEAAHAAGLPVVVHAEGSGTVAAAAEAGADLLAHTPWTEALDDGLIQAAADRMTWISTLDIHGWGDPSPARATAVGNLRRFLGYGGTVRYGTDLGNGPLIAGINAREIRALLEAGLTPDEVLSAMIDTDPAGVAPSWIAGGLDLEPGRFADVLATARVVGDEVRPRTTKA